MSREIHVKPKSGPEPGGILRKLRPTVRMPLASVLRRFSESDRDLLAKRLAEPAECVYDPIFRRVRSVATEPQPVVVARPPGPMDSAANRGGPFAGPAPTPVLSGDEERALFLRFNYCRHRVMSILRKYRDQRLDAVGTQELLKWEHRAQVVRAQIARANTSLVLAMARRSRNSSVELTELVSEGNVALVRCVDKFDASRGFKFSTYACRAILASFSRCAAKAARYRAQFPTAYDPTMERSDHLERRREKLELECVDELKRILFENSADLSAVERRVLSARFALDRDAPKAGPQRKTLDQVGVLLGVSKERVRQIQNQAMSKLRAVLEERFLAAS